MKTPSILPKWMRQIIDNPSLLSEFVEDLSQREQFCTREGVKASKEGNYQRANASFGKAEAYRSLKNSVLINKKEGETQDAFQSQSKTSRKSAARS